MNILAFETTGKYASVACIDRDGKVIEKKSENVLSHLQSLMPLTELLLSECFLWDSRFTKRQMTINDVMCIAASSGPGSFTGIRIGVSSARALAQALKVPCISVPTLQSFLYNDENYKGLVCPVFDARRNQVYAGAYRFSEKGTEDDATSLKGSCMCDGVPSTDEFDANRTNRINDINEIIIGGAYEMDEYLKILRDKADDLEVSGIMFFGDGIDIYSEKIKDWRDSALKDDIRIEVAEESIRYQTASSVAKLALKLYNEGKLMGYEKLTPVYMRKAEAERKLSRI